MLLKATEKNDLLQVQEARKQSSKRCVPFVIVPGFSAASPFRQLWLYFPMHVYTFSCNKVLKPHLNSEVLKVHWTIKPSELWFIQDHVCSDLTKWISETTILKSASKKTAKMFFYRPWAGNEDRYPQSPVSSPDIFASQFAYHRWGYATLLLMTLLGCLLLHGSIIGAFLFNWKNLKKMPHMVIFTICIRDVLVALILIPICVDW